MFQLLETLRLFRTLLCVTETVRRDVMFRLDWCCILRSTWIVRGLIVVTVCGQCTVLWTVHCSVDSALCCGQCIVLWTVHCAVDSALCCGQCTVLWTVHCAVDSALCCRQCTVLWTVHCAVDTALSCGHCTVMLTVLWDFLEACHHSWSWQLPASCCG